MDGYGRHAGQALPTGTVTFLYTDVEGSTVRWESHPEVMKAAVERHDSIIRSAIETSGGRVFRTMGDAFCAAFPAAREALSAALSAQRALRAEPWPAELGGIRVRMALHTGPGEVRDGDYVGAHLNRIARLLAAGHGGQTLLSQAACELVCDALPDGVALRDLGAHRLKDLQRPERIYQLLAAGLPADFPPLKTLDYRPNNLPGQPTAFVGREREVHKAAGMLLAPATRLLTLTGPGGTGKTRLSLEVAGALLDHFREGVFFVPLAPIVDADLVVPTIAQALSVSESGARPVMESLKDFLRDRQLLLVLDNFEQVVAAAPALGDLLAACSKLKLLVTSREVLHLYGEVEFPIPPLTLPSLRHLPPAQELERYEAVRLFAERARSVKPDFELNEQNARAVAEITHRLDGLPLAIELAAARVKLLPPQAMLARLKSRLSLLTGGARDLPARQQTLRGALDWGHDLLGEEDKTLFRRLAVFAGGCSLEAAEAVCYLAGDEGGIEIDVLGGLGSLVDKSLLRQEEGDDGEPRFRMLQIIREYALERLEESGEEAALRQGHALYYVGLAEEAEWATRGLEQRTWFERLESEADNLRAVLEWSLSPGGETEAGLRMAGLLWYFWHTRGHWSEGRRWCRSVLDATSGDSLLRAKVYFVAGYLGFLQGDPVVAGELLRQARRIYQDADETLEARRGLAYTLTMLSAATMYCGDAAEARAQSDEAIAILRQLKGRERWGLMMSLMASGVMILLQTDFTTARSRIAEGIAISREVGDRLMGAQATNYMGDIARIERDYAGARQLYEESLQTFRDHGSRSDIPSALHNLGYVELAHGNVARAAELFDESLRLHQEMVNAQGIAEGLAGFAAVASARGEPGVAARLFAAAEALDTRSGASIWPGERIERERHIARTRDQLDETTWRSRWQEGAAMAMEEAVAYALKAAGAGGEL